MTRASDPRVRFRVWIDGELVAETWIDATTPERRTLASAIAQRHTALIDRADREGRQWLVEVLDPALPRDNAYTRFGADSKASARDGETARGW